MDEHYTKAHCHHSGSCVEPSSLPSIPFHSHLHVSRTDMRHQPAWCGRSRETSPEMILFAGLGPLDICPDSRGCEVRESLGQACVRLGVSWLNIDAYPGIGILGNIYLSFKSLYGVMDRKIVQNSTKIRSQIQRALESQHRGSRIKWW